MQLVETVAVYMASKMRDCRYVAVVSSVVELVESFSYLQKTHLAEIARIHYVTDRGRSKIELQFDLLTHTCDGCPNVVYMFKSLTRDRQHRGRIRTNLSVDAVLATLDMRRLQKSRLQMKKRAHLDPENSEIARHNDAVARRILREDAELEQKHLEDIQLSHVRDHFPIIPSKSDRNQIIHSWQEVMREDKWIQTACAACGQGMIGGNFTRESSTYIDLTLLRNPALPEHVLPTSYAIDMYDGAILCPAGLYDKESRGDLDLCGKCHDDLVCKHVQPRDSLANFQYYGHERLSVDVRKAFKDATLFDLMLVSRCRATRITHLYSSKPTGPTAGKNPLLSQRYNRGNVAIIPQDSVRVRQFLPPGREEIRNAVCALFIGGDTLPTVANIKQLYPVLVCKSRVLCMIEFLIANNPWYIAGGTAFSRANFDDLFHPRDGSNDVGLLRAVEIAHLPGTIGRVEEVGYTDRNDIQEDDGNFDELLMEYVGYTEGDRTPQNYRQMKAVALAWCLDSKKFIRVRGTTSLLDSRHPGLLTFLFPHLDPWGIGGFLHGARQKTQFVSFDRQVRNLLNQVESPFEADPNFAYICWNLIQRASVSQSVCFRISRKSQKTLTQDLRYIGPVLGELVTKWDRNPNAVPVSDIEKKAVAVMNRIKLVAVDLRGSSGYKLCCRNEIRSLTRVLSTPALFITLNPADVMNPLMGVLGGINPDAWRAMSKFERTKFVALHPAAAAKFFDIIIRAFIDIILRPGKEGGYFGRCKAYYGMVEAQGRGTLHLHILIWLEGNPDPQHLREKLVADPGFQTRMFTWLEAMISCETPGTTECFRDFDKVTAKRPLQDPTVIDPRIADAPIVANMTEDMFEIEFQKFVGDLAVVCNWHEHKETCWKHLKEGDERGDSTCRMRIDGSTRAVTELDEATLSILLRRLHPRINNFNDLVMFLMKCNMDIKYIGSGQAAKALVYYVTDYITKADLTTHAGLDALLYAIRSADRLSERDAKESVYKSTAVQQRSLLIKSVNSMMARQEMSHQQVMSYLVGGGDRYTGHVFQSLRWKDLDMYIRTEEGMRVGKQVFPDGLIQHVEQQGENVENPMADGADGFNGTDEVVVDIGDGVESEEADETPDDLFMSGCDTLELNSQIMDYRFRSLDTIFDMMCVWEFVACVNLFPLKEEAARLQNRKQSSGGPGRPVSIRGRFSSEDHPKHGTHMMRKRAVDSIPVLLGPGVGRPDGTNEEYKRWCRSMMILFKPWRNLNDLVPGPITWTTAFEACTFPDIFLRIMHNFGLERQCKDARDEYSSLRRQGRVKVGLISGVDATGFDGDEDSFEVALVNDGRLDDYTELTEPSELVDDDNEFEVLSPAEEAVRLLRLSGVFSNGDVDGEIGDSARLVEERERESMVTQVRLMERLRKEKRPRAVLDDESHPVELGNENFKRTKEAPGTVRVATLEGATHTRRRMIEQVQTSTSILEDIIRVRKMHDNPEQERAVRIVAEHMIANSPEQLVMYVGGSAGTGKSYVIKSIVELFKRSGRSNELMLAAPTGCAAVLVGGYTIHALLMLPQKILKGTLEQLSDIWKSKTCFIIDEVSMISALLMSQISCRLAAAKSWDPDTKYKPFGGLNMIFLGDMGQLRPVKALSMFSHVLVEKLIPSITQTLDGQSALHGAYLWRSIDKVVLLKKNMRSIRDPKYTALLERVRLGNVCLGQSDLEQQDYDVLLERMIGTLPDAAEFHRAPVIVADKALRDPINDNMLRSHARSLNQSVHYYRSIDRYKGKRATGEQMCRLWRVRSTDTKDSLGLLTMFVGMQVMVTENIAISHKVVNGAKGTVTDIVYETDDEGYRYALCVYVRIPGSGIVTPGLERDVVPVVPVLTRFSYVSIDGATFNITRKQMPLIPSYSLTDYKSQGQGLDVGIVDLRGARSVQSQYVMLSRVRTLSGLAILRPFEPNKIHERLSQEFRNEFQRLDNADRSTAVWYEDRVLPVVV